MKVREQLNTLNSYLNIYKNNALNLDFEWENISRHELMCKYCDMLDTNNSDQDNCLSALIVRYWSFILTYSARSFNAYKDIDVYEWLVDAIVKASKDRLWLDKKSKFYGNHRASETCINIYLFEKRIDRIRHANCSVRAGMYNGKTFDLDKLLEDETMNECFALDSFEDAVVFKNDIINYIKKQETKSDYMTILVIDGILCGDVFSLWKAPHKLSQKKVLHHIKTLSNSYLRGVSKRYNINYDNLSSAYDVIKTYAQGKLTRAYNNSLNKISQKWKKEVNYVG